MDRRPLLTVVAGISLAVTALAGFAAVAPRDAAGGFVPPAIARLGATGSGVLRAGAFAATPVGAAATTSIVLPPLPSNTGPDATYQAPFVTPDETTQPPGPDSTAVPRSTVAGTTVPVTTVPGTTGTGTHADTVTVVDDLGMLTVELPAAWQAIDTAPVEANPALAASPDWDRWLAWEAPGLVIVAYPKVSDPMAMLISDPLTAECRPGELSRFSERGRRGVQQIFTDCGGDYRVTNYVWIVSPPDDAYSLYVNVQLVGAGDRGVLELIRSTFDTVPGATLTG